jgi:hypothetical protein
MAIEARLMTKNAGTIGEPVTSINQVPKKSGETAEG